MRQSVALIPAYNPGHELAAVVHKLSTSGIFRQIIVVNDGSDPNCSLHFRDVEASKGVTVLEHAVNLGKGAALKTGFNHILCQYPEVTGIVTADADGQHRPQDIIAVARQLQHSPQQLVLGVRNFSGKVPLRSQIGNKLTQLVFRALTGYRLPDTQTGLRGIPVGFVADLLPLNTSGYDFELDMLILARTKHIDIAQVPIATVYQHGNQTSHFNPVLDSLKIYFVFLRFVVASLVTTAVSLGAFALAFGLTGSLLVSETTLRLVGIGIQFHLNRGMVFHSQCNWPATLLKFMILVFLLGVVSYYLTLGIVDLLHLGILPARILTALLLYLPSFSIQRDFIFQSREPCGTKYQ